MPKRKNSWEKNHEFTTKIVEFWLQVFVTHNIEISIFIILVWVVDLFFKLQTSTRYLLWALALVKIMIPPFFSLPAYFQQSIPLTALATEVVTLPGVVEAALASNISVSAWIFFGWFISAILFFAFILMQNIRLWQRLRGAKELYSGEIAVENFAGLRLFEQSKISVPALTGLLRPRLYLPKTWRVWPESQLNALLEHEKAHYRHRDLWMLCLQHFCLILFSFNPLVWLVHFQLKQIRELRCDEAALAKTGISVTVYSNFVLSFSAQNTLQAPALAAGKYFFSKNGTLAKRINHILTFKEEAMKNAWLKTVVLPCLLAGIILPLSLQCGDGGNALDEGAMQSKNEKQYGATTFVIDDDGKVVSMQSMNEKELAKAISGKYSAPPPPPEGDEKNLQTSAFDTPPTPIGGFKAIQAGLKYPKIAKAAGIEGRVIIQVLVSESGKVTDHRVIKSLGNSGCDEAAIRALKGVQWQPAQKDGKAVKAWVAAPIIFRLN